MSQDLILAHLTDLDGFVFPLGGSLDIDGGGGEYFDAMASYEAVEGCEPIFVLVECQGYGILEGGEGSFARIDEGRVVGGGVGNVVISTGGGGSFGGNYSRGGGEGSFVFDQSQGQQ